MKDHNAFYVSDSIKHLISEDSFADDSTKLDSKFALSDLIAKVKAFDNITYYDVVAYKFNKTLSLQCDASAIKFFHQSGTLQVSLLLKNDAIEINLNCKFVEFNKTSHDTYIYILSICNH